MLFNPELRRNVWLDFTPHRMILTPVVIAILVYLSHLTTGSSGSTSTSMYLAYFFIFLWGVKSASETVIDEINMNTWDFQRQSAISPWAMTFGKLLGSTLFAWYGAIISLLFYFFIYPDVRTNLSLGKEILILICGGLFAQSLALLASLQIIPQIRREHTHKTFRYFLLGLFVGFFATSMALDVGERSITWFGFSFQLNNFTVTSLMLFAAWTIWGLQRSFSKELQYQKLPLAWTTFTIFTMVYFSGLSANQIDFMGYLKGVSNPDPQALQDFEILLQKAPYYIAFFVAQLLLYIALFTESLTTVRYKKIILRLKNKNGFEAAEQTPLWSISFVLMVAAGIISIIQLSTLSQNMTDTFSPTILLLTTTLFAIRDILLVHYFNFSTNIQRILGAAVLYLFLLYVLIPSLLVAMDLGKLSVMFIPSWGQNTSLALGSLAVQIVIAGYLCVKHWRKNWADTRSAPTSEM